VQRNQDIKGFSLLELIVVIVIVGVISAVAYPNFSSWKQEREVRAATEKVANMISNLSTQVSRGSFSYSQFWVKTISGRSPVFFTKGMRNSTYSNILNNGKTPDCKMTLTGTWDAINSSNTVTIDKQFYNNYIEYYDPEGGFDEIKIALQFDGESAVCFGKSGNYYKTMGKLPLAAGNRNMTIEGLVTSNYIILCPAKNAKSNKCPRGGKDLETPAYLIKWSRFGNISKYKWVINRQTKNGSWIRQ
jgi:prepilin-type N-terminal cleavage/methylation domain-containing protein